MYKRKIKGKRVRGIPRYMMRDNAFRWIENNKEINDIIHRARDRGIWRDITSNIRIKYET